MEKFVLTIYQPEGESPPAEVLDPIMRRLESLNDEMKAAGVWVFAAGLGPPGAATVLRDYDGKVTATDGPFIESKEQIGGFTVIEAIDREAAIYWGSRLAEVVALPVELRALEA